MENANEYTIIKGILGFIYGLIFSVVSWYIVPIFISIIPAENTILIGIFWASLVIMWILALFVRPIYIIRKALQY
jgi:hypothetical protein